MKQRCIQWLLVLGAGLSCLMATVAAHSAIDGTRLVGLAMHQDTGRNIYVGALHYDDQIPKPDDLVAAPGPKAMEYRVVARRTSIRSLMGGILLQAELAVGTPPSTATSTFVEEIMGEVKGSLYAGDSLEIVLDSENTVTAILNGYELAHTTDKAVLDYLIMGWVGEGGPSTAFRSSILSERIATPLLNIYEAHTASVERVAAIENWGEPAPGKPSTDELVAVTATPDSPVAAVANETEAIPAKQATEVAASAGSIALPPPAETQSPTAVAHATAVARVTPNPPPPPEHNTANSAPQGELQSKKAQELDPDNTAPLPVLLASITPTREMMQPQLEDDSAADAIDAIEYSQRLAAFNTAVLKRVYAQIRYPKSAVRRNIQGALELDVSISKAGELLAVSVAVSSGHTTLDKSALKAATKAFSGASLTDIDQVAISEYSEDGEKLVIPIPVSFILTE